MHLGKIRGERKAGQHDDDRQQAIIGKRIVEANGNLNRGVSVIGGIKNNSDRLLAGIGAGLNYAEGKIHADLDQAVNLNTIHNSYQAASGQRYYRFNSELSLRIGPFAGLRFYSDASVTSYRGSTSASLSKAVLLVASGIEKYLSKNRQLSLSLAGFDLLNQNPAIQRSVSMTGRIEDVQTNTLDRYFYLKLNYRLQRAGAARGG